jgi:hypothetical protein
MSFHLRRTRRIAGVACVALAGAAPLLVATAAGDGPAMAGAAPRAFPQSQGGAGENPEPRPASVAGKWTVSLDMSMGTATVTLVLEQDAAKLTGTYEGRYGTFPLEGTVKGRAIEFVVSTTVEGQASALWFGGEVAEDGESMKGPAELGGAGDAYWTAKRAK